MKIFASLRGATGLADGSLGATDLPRVREAFGWIVLLGGILALASVGHAHYPIQHWLFWRFATYWIVSAVWACACASGGIVVLRALAIELPAREHLLFSFAAGVLLFVWGMFLAGIVGAFRPVVAIVWPLVLLLAGGKRAWAMSRRLLVRIVRARPVGFAERAATGGGLLGVAMLYLTITTPSNVGFDAQWYHLPIAEHYVAAGAIVPFEEGWFLGTYPHLASLVYAWGFLLPLTTLFDRVLIAAHLEFTFFLATLAAIPLLVRRLIPGANVRASWAALFLFPGIFLYDGSLFVAADHVLAFWAIPSYLALLRVARRADVRAGLLLAVVLAGAYLSKYQALYLLVPAGTVFIYFQLRTVRKQGPRQVLPLFTASLAGLVLTAQHWLHNWWWYGDPFYPYLRHHLRAHPFAASAMNDLESVLQSEIWRTGGTVFHRLRETATALLTFSFEPHDWPTYHGTVPVFGSLFTIASLLLPMLKEPRRIALLVSCTLAGVALWFLTFHQDRYLQALLPWMVCSTVAIAYSAWTAWPALRPLLVALPFLQMIWGGDVYFIPANDDSHELNRVSPIVAAVDLFSSGYRKEYEKRLHPYDPWETIGAMLPPKSKVLLHERYIHLGLGAMSVSDLPSYQGGISYRDAAKPDEIVSTLSRFGVTHVLWETGVSHSLARMSEDLAFFRWATQFTTDRQIVGRFTIGRLVSVGSPTSSSELVAVYDCPADQGRLRSLRELDEDIDGLPIDGLRDTLSAPRDADFVVIEKGCSIAWDSTDFEHMADRGAYQLWTRRLRP